jgi:hypothetical protein
LRPLAKDKHYKEVLEDIDEAIGIEHEEVDPQGHVKHPANMTMFKQVLENNRKWVKGKTSQDPDFFKKHQPSQKPNFLWIGCSDSRMPAN